MPTLSIQSSAPAQADDTWVQSAKDLADPVSAVVSVISLLIALWSMRVASKARADSREARRHQLTKDRLEEFRSAAFTERRRWVENELKGHATQHDRYANCGLTELNVGAPITMPTRDGQSIGLKGGEVAADVLNFFNHIARDLKKGRLEEDVVLEAMDRSIVAAWHALQPHLRFKTVSDYYRYYRRRYSISRLAHVIESHETTEERIRALRRA